MKTLQILHVMLLVQYMTVLREKRSRLPEDECGCGALRSFQIFDRDFGCV